MLRWVVCFVSLTFCASIAQAQQIYLHCIGSYNQSFPDVYEGRTSPAGASIDLDKNIFHSPLGEFKISNVTDISILIDDSYIDDKTGHRIKVAGGIDRVRGTVSMAWIDEVESANPTPGRVLPVNMTATFECSVTHRRF